jgi:hypothetical protein
VAEIAPVFEVGDGSPVSRVSTITRWDSARWDSVKAASPARSERSGSWTKWRRILRTAWLMNSESQERVADIVALAEPENETGRNFGLVAELSLRRARDRRRRCGRGNPGARFFRGGFDKPDGGGG